MALTGKSPVEDPGGRKGAALRKAGFLYDDGLDVFTYRAAGKIAVRLPSDRPALYGRDTSLLIGLGWTN
jgi:hypothetical protein